MDEINIVKKFIEDEFEGVCSAHDIYHIERVYKMSVRIFQGENDGGDEVVIGISALLHEMFDDKFFDGNIKQQKVKVSELLDSLSINNTQREKILYIISNIGYGKSLSGKVIDKSKEFQIVEEADSLENLGAIIIARTFAYGGKVGKPIHDPNIKAKKNITEEEYLSKGGTSINFFYEKALKMKEGMKTKVGKQIAEERHKFLESYLEQFFGEWDGER